MSRRRAQLYLQVPARYCEALGGLRWGPYGEAVEFVGGTDEGRTFAFAAEVARFIEGLCTSGGPLLAFGSLLHFLYLIGLGERAPGRGAGHRLERLAGPFRALGRPARNAGALCGWLCRDVPGVADPPALEEVSRLLNGGDWAPQLMIVTHPTLGASDYAEQPALAPDEFEALVARELAALSDEAVRHWLKHGRAPIGPVEERLAPLPPLDWARALAEIEQRPRLAGAARWKAQLEGALSLPPRRLDWSSPRTGGYADVATRGQPEQVLPIQLALDDDEFLRRFAQRELLYYQREEPRQPTTDELIVLLDQGVRTWGGTRLILVGAALALIRWSARRGVSVQLVTTGDKIDEPPAPLSELSSKSLAERLEASDFSPHPGRALARLALERTAAWRDVVLLTHPRSLDDPKVIGAMRFLCDGAETRLFAVTADAGGDVELSEIKDGRPAVLNRCRVDMAGPTESSKPKPAAPRAKSHDWSGPVEPDVRAFSAGRLDRISTAKKDRCSLIDFDESGERVLIVGQHGIATMFRIDGSEMETLPRPVIDGKTVTQSLHVVGVSGGFVIVGRRRGGRVLVYYDFTTRTCGVSLDEPEGPLHYCSDLHTIVGRSPAQGKPRAALDLAMPGKTTPRAIAAIKRAESGQKSQFIQDAALYTGPSEPCTDLTCVGIRHVPKTGEIFYLRHFSADWMTVKVLADGRSLLRETEFLEFLQGGDVLAARFRCPVADVIAFVSVTRTEVLGVFSFSKEWAVDRSFALSRDGRRFAVRYGARQFAVYDVPGDAPPVFVTPWGDDRPAKEGGGR